MSFFATISRKKSQSATILYRVYYTEMVILFYSIFLVFSGVANDKSMDMNNNRNSSRQIPCNRNHSNNLI